MEDTSQKNTSTEEKSGGYFNLRFKKPKPLTALVIIVVIAIIIILLFFKGLFFAASVDGVLISRYAVIKELQAQGGKQVLEEMIKDKLIKSSIEKENINITKDVIDKEIEIIRTEIASQNKTLESILKEQGGTEENLREQILTQKKLEEILSDKTKVFDNEIDTYLKSPQVIKPEDIGMAEFREQIRKILRQQKFQKEAQEWVSNVTSSAKVKYYVNY